MKREILDNVTRIEGEGRVNNGDWYPVLTENSPRADLTTHSQWPGDRDMAAYRDAAARARSDLIRQLWGSAVQRIRSWRERQRAITALERLDDHALADFGVSRGDIHRLRSGDWSVAEFNAEREALRAQRTGNNGKHRSLMEPERIRPQVAANLPAFDHAA